MNVTFLLVTAVAILLMSQRFWGRMLRAIVFPEPAPSSTGPNGGSVLAHAFDVAASGGAVAMVGIGLALTWGWAPVYVWILVASAFLGGLLKSALGFLARTSGEAEGLAAIEATCGNALAGAARAALLITLMMMLPLVILMLAALLHAHVAAGLVLVIQCLLALLLRRFMGDGTSAAGAGLVLLAGAGAVPLGIVAARAWGDWLMPTASGSSMTIVVAALLVIAVVLARVPRARLVAPLAVLISIALVALLVASLAAVAIENPDAGYLAYFRPDVGAGALPLVMACGVAGTLPLLGAILPGRPSTATQSACTGPTFEGLLAMVLLAAVLAAPSLLPATPVALPDWRAGIDPRDLSGYAVSSLAALGGRLPVDNAIIEDIVSSVLAGLLAVTLVAVLAAVRHLVVNLAPRSGFPRGLLDGGLIGAVAGGCALVLWHGAMPADAWLLGGQLALWFGALVLGAAAIGANRLRRPMTVPVATAAVLALLFFWTVVQQLALAVPDGRWEVVAMQAVAALIGLIGSAGLAAAALRASA